MPVIPTPTTPTLVPAIDLRAHGAPYGDGGEIVATVRIRTAAGLRKAMAQAKRAHNADRITAHEREGYAILPDGLVRLQSDPTRRVHLVD